MAGEDDEEDVGSPAQTASVDSAPATASPSVVAGASASAPQTLPAPSIDSLVVTPEQMNKTREQLLAIQKAKMAQGDADRAEVTKRLETDRARMEEAYKASAALPDTPKWDSAQKSVEHYTDPVQAFGSIGSVFAMLASSFAGLPMEAGLNAGAAAINAIHKGDEEGYKREFETWQKNTDLAIKRHDMQRQAYNDATNLMNSNLNAGRTEMELAATKFGDQKVQALLENGMDKELTDLFVARNKSAAEMQSAWDKVQLEHDKITDLRSDPRYLSGDQEQKNQAVAEWTQRWTPNSAQKLRYDAKADYLNTWKKNNPNYTPEGLLQANKDFADAEAGTPDAPGAISGPKLKAKAIEEIVSNSQKEVDAGKRSAPMTIAEATAQYNRQTATPSGNRMDDIAKQADQYQNGIGAIDRTLAMIDKHVGAVGAAGYATRLGERLGNIVGSNETDRSQIAHDIEYLQGIAPRLLNDSSGRPLSSEAGKINRLISGLNLGDTTANTKRSLGEIRELWAKMQQDNLSRRNGTPNLGGYGTGGSNPEGAGGAPKKSGAVPKWQSAPIVGPRSDIDAGASYG